MNKDLLKSKTDHVTNLTAFDLDYVHSHLKKCTIIRFLNDSDTLNKTDPGLQIKKQHTCSYVNEYSV